MLLLRRILYSRQEHSVDLHVIGHVHEKICNVGISGAVIIDGRLEAGFLIPLLDLGYLRLPDLRLLGELNDYPVRMGLDLCREFREIRVLKYVTRNTVDEHLGSGRKL